MREDFLFADHIKWSGKHRRHGARSLGGTLQQRRRPRNTMLDLRQQKEGKAANASEEDEQPDERQRVHTQEVCDPEASLPGKPSARSRVPLEVSAPTRRR